MRTEKKIKNKIKKITEILDEAERKLDYRKVPDYSTYRRYTTQINTLRWVLDPTRKAIKWDKRKIWFKIKRLGDKLLW